MPSIAALTRAMLDWEAGCPHRAQHLLKVWAFAKLIAQGEGLSEEECFRIETAALVHDIGIRASLEKGGKGSGPEQEAEGPALAAALLDRLGYDEAAAQRTAFLVGHHHTVQGVDGLDWRILLEADFLVNAHEGSATPEAIREAESVFFRTGTGISLLRTLYFGIPTPYTE